MNQVYSRVGPNKRFHQTMGIGSDSISGRYESVYQSISGLATGTEELQVSPIKSSKLSFRYGSPAGLANWYK